MTRHTLEPATREITDATSSVAHPAPRDLGLGKRKEAR